MASTSATESLLLLLPTELRLQIYTYLLTPSISIAPLQRLTTRSHPCTLPPLHLSIPLLLVSKRIHAEALPILYTQNTFCAHSTLLTSFPFLLLPSQPIVHPHNSTRIRKWYIAIRLDTDPRFTFVDVTKAFSGAEVLEVEAWQAEYGSADVKVLRLFEGVRGVKRAKVSGSVGGGYCQWLEGAMMRGVGEMVQCFGGEGEGKGYDIWERGNR